MARKSKYTPELVAEIVRTLAAGASVKDTCGYVGISQDTFFEWCKAKTEFSEATTRARSQGRIGAVAVIRKAISEGDTQSAQWFLERTDPESWARRTYAKIEGLDELLALAKAKGINASEMFAAMIAELANADADGG